MHFDVAGLFRSFKAVNLVQPRQWTDYRLPTRFMAEASRAVLNVELVKNFRFIGTAFYSYGGGRYIASTGGPDLIIRPDGTLSGIHSGSAIGGFEYQVNPNTIIYGYYSGAYFGRNVDSVVTTLRPPERSPAIARSQPISGTASVKAHRSWHWRNWNLPAAPGGSANSANRYLYEPTIGIHHYLWRNPSYGDLRIMTQYSYVSRTPWFVAAGQPSTRPTSAWCTSTCATICHSAGRT